MDDPRLTEAERLLQAFPSTVESLMLATLTPDGLPHASHAPFVRDDDGNFYVLVSGLSAHTGHLLANPAVAILLIEDESQARQAYARKRLGFDCHAETVATDDPVRAPLLRRFRERFGEIIDVLTGLPDFVLFRLVPQSGSFVLGFGQAYRIEAPDLERLVPVRPGK